MLPIVVAIHVDENTDIDKDIDVDIDQGKSLMTANLCPLPMMILLDPSFASAMSRRSL